jgi:hypothetical protein
MKKIIVIFCLILLHVSNYYSQTTLSSEQENKYTYFQNNKNILIDTTVEYIKVDTLIQYTYYRKKDNKRDHEYIYMNDKNNGYMFKEYFTDGDEIVRYTNYGAGGIGLEKGINHGTLIEYWKTGLIDRIY